MCIVQTLNSPKEWATKTSCPTLDFTRQSLLLVSWVFFWRHYMHIQTWLLIYLFQNIQMGLCNMHCSIPCFYFNILGGHGEGGVINPFFRWGNWGSTGLKSTLVLIAITAHTAPPCRSYTRSSLGLERGNGSDQRSWSEGWIPAFQGLTALGSNGCYLKWGSPLSSASPPLSQQVWAEGLRICIREKLPKGLILLVWCGDHSWRSTNLGAPRWGRPYSQAPSLHRCWAPGGTMKWALCCVLLSSGNHSFAPKDTGTSPWGSYSWQGTQDQSKEGGRAFQMAIHLLPVATCLMAFSSF